MFQMRTSKPKAGNKYYITKRKGGYSNAIIGKPTDSECNVLSNCVGYAYGRFNEIGGYGFCKYLAPVNAENFMKYIGSCKVGQVPKVGACMVWSKGKVGVSSDGAGHVEIVEKVIDRETVYTSASGYGNKPFWNSTRKKGNGNWGSDSPYKFLGFIYNPAVKDDPKPKPVPTPVKPPVGLQVGDRVRIISEGNGSSYGNSNAARAIGTERNVTAIYANRPFPYQVGVKGYTDGRHTIGFYKANALRKI